MAHRPHLRRTLATPAAPRRQPTAGHATRVAVAAVLVTLGVAGCSSGGAGDDSASTSDTAGASAGRGGVSEGGASADAPVGDVDSAHLGGRAGDAAGKAGTLRRAAPMTRQVIRTGQVTLRAEDVPGLRDDVDRLVQRVGGYVSSEKSVTDDEGRLVEDRVVLRVPSARYAQVLDGFEEFATVVSPSTESDDVTTEVIDVDSRVRTAEVSLARLRRFLGRSNDVDTLVRLESEVARREADLASLRAQQDYLRDQTSLATITATLQPPPPPGTHAEPAAGGGFLAGLSGGWRALEGVVVVALTLLGALLPFALVAALVGGPVLLAVRATRRRRAAAPPQPPVPQGVPGS